jgi:hypothetical protein
MMHTPLIGLTPLVIPIGLIHWKKYSLGERYFLPSKPANQPIEIRCALRSESAYLRLTTILNA